MGAIHSTAIALRGAGVISPLDLDGYIAEGGFKAFSKALQMEPAELIQIVEASGLRGRGGAGFPTGVKWRFTAGEEGLEKYVIANADEGEPGTFKDRYIMEQTPFRFLEGLMIAAVAISAREAWIYIRHEYTGSMSTLEAAIRKLYAAGLVGGSERPLDLLMTSGAGSYLCGDETTLLESMEGKRGNPRYKPPFPAQKGYRGKPTVVNNVETLAHIPDIVMNGSEWYRSIGTEKSPGTKLYCLSGRINRPGVYELPMGTTLRTLIDQYGLGVRTGGKFKGALLGGAAGTFADSSILDIPMDYDHLKQAGATLGSGAVIVLDESANIPELLANILHFFKHESCGKCVPCRVGCQRLITMMNLLQSQSASSEELMQQMEKEATLMAATSLCGLGQSPVLPIKSAFSHFTSDFLNPHNA
jgi:NADH-quinone oxidoreductase subunit F